MHTAIIIGTGFSGLCMAIKLKQQGIHDFIILEKASDIGGTWRENTYPGAECDVPSALYSFSFEPNPNWVYKWSMQPQILEYMQYVAKKYDLYPHIHFQQELTSAEWQEEQSNWLIHTKSGALYESKTFISAIGQLHHPNIPDFEGKNRFEGDSFHSAQWNHNISLAGKTVGVIGNAASGVQFIPEIAKTARKVIIIQRSANWILPKQDRMYKDWEKKLVGRFPFLLKIYRNKIWLLTGGLFLLLKSRNRWLRKIYQRKNLHYIKKHIKDPPLIKALTPDYPMGAKRILFSDTYYPALARPNVELLSGGVQEIRSNGLLAGDGSIHELDVLIYATGFKAHPFLMGLDIKGSSGKTIQTAWKNGSKTYLGITTHGFPNLFMLYGPNTNLGHSSILLMAEAQSAYIAQCISGLQKNNWASLEVKPEVVKAYQQSLQSRLKKMIWTEVPHSWYKSADGTISNNYPGRTMEYARRTRRVDFGDYIHIS